MGQVEGEGEEVEEEDVGAEEVPLIGRGVRDGKWRKG